MEAQNKMNFLWAQSEAEVLSRGRGETSEFCANPICEAVNADNEFTEFRLQSVTSTDHTPKQARNPAGALLVQNVLCLVTEFKKWGKHLGGKHHEAGAPDRSDPQRSSGRTPP